MANKNLNAAKTAKKDEFYTQLSDIERELQRIGRSDLIGKLYDNVPKHHPRAVYDPKAVGSSPDIPHRRSAGKVDKPNTRHKRTTSNGGKKPKSYNPNFMGGRRHKQR